MNNLFSKNPTDVATTLSVITHIIFNKMEIYVDQKGTLRSNLNMTDKKNCYFLFIVERVEVWGNELLDSNI